jgi:hypothetical protein
VKATTSATTTVQQAPDDPERPSIQRVSQLLRRVFLVAAEASKLIFRWHTKPEKILEEMEDTAASTDCLIARIVLLLASDCMNGDRALRARSYDFKDSLGYSLAYGLPGETTIGDCLDKLPSYRVRLHNERRLWNEPVKADDTYNPSSIIGLLQLTHQPVGMRHNAELDGDAVVYQTMTVDNNVQTRSGAIFNSAYEITWELSTEEAHEANKKRRGLIQVSAACEV